MRGPLGLFSAIAVVALASTSSAAIISLTDTTGDPASVVALPGTSFQIQAAVTLDTGQDALGIGFNLESSQSGIFTITGRSLDAGNPFTDLTSTDTQVLTNSPGLDPMNGVDLGGITPDLKTRPPGTYSLYTFTIAVSPTAPLGDYQISAVLAYYADANFDTSGDMSSTIYNVGVPEPVFMGMMAVISGGLLLRRRAPEAEL